MGWTEIDRAQEHVLKEEQEGDFDGYICPDDDNSFLGLGSWVVLVLFPDLI